MTCRSNRKDSIVQNRKTPSPNEVKTSLTAVTVAMGFARSVLTGYDYLFDRREAELTNHLCNIGRQSLRSFNWVVTEGLSYFPLFNSTVFL